MKSININRSKSFHSVSLPPQPCGQVIKWAFFNIYELCIFSSYLIIIFSYTSWLRFPRQTVSQRPKVGGVLVKNTIWCRFEPYLMYVIRFFLIQKMSSWIIKCLNCVAFLHTFNTPYSSIVSVIIFTFFIRNKTK